MRNGRAALILGWMVLMGLPVTASSRDHIRLARLSHVEGHVSFQHVGEIDWNAASINMALLPADRIYTGDNGRAEIHFDDGSVLRLAERTDVELVALGEDLIQCRVLVGLVSLTVHSSVRFEVNTPAAAFTTLEPGAYRFDVTETGDSDGIVRQGLLNAANNRFTLEVGAREVIHVTPGDQGSHQLARYDQRDAWDEWNDRRDADLMAYDSRKYLPDYVYVGAGDLDRYGRWVTVESYGPAWVPYYVDASWSPYWHGRWVYRPFWGWTWVSHEPWGWLPYHYGRWHHSIGFGWCWVPGPSFGFHFWSPGLVRFYHGQGGISWCPLGPGDYYNVNNYFFNTRYNYHLNNLRLLQTRGPEDLTNRRAPGAFKSLGRDEFVNGSPDGRTRVVRDRDGVPGEGRGQLVAGALQLQPSTRSYAPLPDRSPARPTRDSGLPSVVRTQPAGRAAQEGRFVAIRSAEALNRPQAGRSAGAVVVREGRSSERRDYQVDIPRAGAASSQPTDTRDGAKTMQSRQPAWNRLTSAPPVENSARGREVESSPPGRAASSSRANPRTGLGEDRRDAAAPAAQTPGRALQTPQTERKTEQVNPRSRGTVTPTPPPARPPSVSSDWNRRSDAGSVDRSTAGRPAPPPAASASRSFWGGASGASRSFSAPAPGRAKASSPAISSRSAGRPGNVSGFSAPSSPAGRIVQSGQRADSRGGTAVVRICLSESAGTRRRLAEKAL